MTYVYMYMYIPRWGYWERLYLCVSFSIYLMHISFYTEIQVMYGAFDVHGKRCALLCTFSWCVVPYNV